MQRARLITFRSSLYACVSSSSSFSSATPPLLLFLLRIIKFVLRQWEEGKWRARHMLSSGGYNFADVAASSRSVPSLYVHARLRMREFICSAQADSVRTESGLRIPRSFSGSSHFSQNDLKTRFSYHRPFERGTKTLLSMVLT